jgi:hypothetical protein
MSARPLGPEVTAFATVVETFVTVVETFVTVVETFVTMVDFSRSACKKTLALDVLRIAV